jgi:hypothetical protein
LHKIWIRSSKDNKEGYTDTEITWKLNSVALVCKRTIPTERTSHVDEVSANFCG